MGSPDGQKPLLAGGTHERRTEMNEPTMEKLVTAAWKETEREHKNYVAERIKRRNEKLNQAYSSNGKYLHQWIRQEYNEESRWIHHDELPRDSPDTRRSVETDFRQVGWRSIEDTTSEMNYKELIETPIWQEDIRTSPMANIKKQACVPSPLHPRSTAHRRARDTDKR